jgi:hypothetical protein
MGIREFINKQPALGWGLAALAGLIAVFTFFRNIQLDETSELTQLVTIKCSETGKEWKMVRGAMEKELMMRPYPVNPDEGLVNPDTGKPTGFPIDDWKLSVDRCNTMRAPLAEADKQRTSKPAPSTKPPADAKPKSGR